jgi:Ala-tRNA(Pro) deacylase
MNIADFLRQEKVKFDVISHRDTYNAQTMAQTLHVSGHHVAKTVLLRADGGKAFVVAVLPASRSIDLHLASQLLGGRQLELATEKEIADKCRDCELGVLPPFGSYYGMMTIVDASISEDEEIVFEGNTHHETIRMLFGDFRSIEKPVVGHFTQLQL